MSSVVYREEPCRTALNRVRGMSFRWSLNPYMGCVHRCTFCFVRAFEARADRPSGDAYGRSIRIKTNVVAKLRQEVSRSRWERELVAIGTATDPYQPAEGRHRLTRGCLAVLAEAANPFSLLTRGPLIMRDVDVLSDATGRADTTVSFSVPTLDQGVVERTEPGTAPPRQRLRALSVLAAAGVRAGVGMAPILPGLSDSPAALKAVVIAARDAGAAFIWTNVLYLKPGTREHFLESLAREWPEQLETYRQIYRNRAYPDRALTSGVKAEVRDLAEALGVGSNRVSQARASPEATAAATAQLSLQI